MFPLFGKSVIGLDIGRSAIKAVRVKGDVVQFAAVYDISDREERHASAMAETLGAFVSAHRLRSVPAAVAIPGESVFVRHVTFPVMPLSELQDAVRWEIRRQVPYPPEDAVFDFVAQATDIDVSVTFAAVEKKKMNEFLDPFASAGIKVVAVDIAPLCLMRSAGPLNPGNTLFIDIGHSSTEFSISKGGSLRMTRTVDFGAGPVAERLGAKDLSSADEAAMKEPLQELLREATRSIDYYNARFKEKTLSELVLSGGLAANAAVRNFFASLIDIPIRTADPFKGLSLPDEGLRLSSPRFSVAMGLSRRPL